MASPRIPPPWARLRETFPNSTSAPAYRMREAEPRAMTISNGRKKSACHNTAQSRCNMIFATRLQYIAALQTRLTSYAKTLTFLMNLVLRDGNSGAPRANNHIRALFTRVLHVHHATPSADESFDLCAWPIACDTTIVDTSCTISQPP